jgi:hypothetical protein
MGEHIFSAHDKSLVHTAVRNCIQRFAQEGRIITRLEPRFPFSFGLRPADLFLTLTDGDICMDFAISAILLRLDLLPISKDTEAYGASTYITEVKSAIGKKQYIELVTSNGIKHFPIVLEPYGAIEPSAFPIFQSLIHEYAAALNIDVSIASLQFFTRLSFTIQNAIAGTILRCRSSSILGKELMANNNE